jgi:hypothetical protein
VARAQEVMSKYAHQLLAHEFLLKKFDSLESFTRDEFDDACGWPKDKDTFGTYWTKQFRQLLVPAENGAYRVSEVFRRFVEWDRFKTHVTQNRPVHSEYNRVTYSSVMMFEFFMPLTNEGYLRTSLDALFYKDTVKRRLKANLSELKKRFPNSGKTDVEYLDDICAWVARLFLGYSIGHVAGRYRAGALKTHHEAHQNYHDRYLVDESTAIVRFIIPLGDETKTAFGEDGVSVPSVESSRDFELGKQAALIRYFFGILFIQQIVEAVNGEDEIWLLESGLRHKLHVWRKA